MLQSVKPFLLKIQSFLVRIWEKFLLPVPSLFIRLWKWIQATRIYQFISGHALPLIVLSVVCFMVGLAMALSTAKQNMEKKKHGFKTRKYTRFEEKIDRKLSEGEIAADMDYNLESSLLQDGQIHHASQKFQS